MFTETERKWLLIAPHAFTADGTSNGIVTVADTSPFRVKMTVTIQSMAVAALVTPVIEVKRVISTTQMMVGPVGNIATPADISAYLVSDVATIGAPEQPRASLQSDTIQQATYEQEPVMARRVIMVDDYGQFYDESNPFPVSATFSGSITIPLDNPDSPANLNTTLSLQATEYTITIPVTCKQFTLKSRDQTALLQMAFISGQSGTNYTKIPYGCNYTSPVLSLTGPINVYVQCPNKSGVIAESIIWNKI